VSDKWDFEQLVNDLGLKRRRDIHSDLRNGQLSTTSSVLQSYNHKGVEWLELLTEKGRSGKVYVKFRMPKSRKTIVKLRYILRMLDS